MTIATERGDAERLLADREHWQGEEERSLARLHDRNESAHVEAAALHDRAAVIHERLATLFDFSYELLHPS